MQGTPHILVRVIQCQCQRSAKSYSGILGKIKQITVCYIIVINSILYTDIQLLRKL